MDIMEKDTEICSKLDQLGFPSRHCR